MIGGIELGGTKCIAAIAEKPNSIIDTIRIPTSTPEKTLSDIFDFFRSYELKSLGIATFGPVCLDSSSEKYGTILSDTKEDWLGANVLSFFKQQYSFPITVDTDVNASAIAEFEYGSGKKFNSLVYLTVGTGIGGGAIINGQPLHGNLHPEMGHIIIDDEEEGICRIHTNCLEGLASGPAIEKRWKISPQDLPSDHEAWNLEAKYLARGLSSIIYLLSPEIIVIGGGVMKQTQLLDMIKTETSKLLNCFVPLPQISPPKLGDYTGVTGALKIANSSI
ncbi:MAG: hypothetical protein BEU04_02650 [Marine Group III euryarchaeote CG-Bathy1]|uniref:fructokinase n=2 Tax=Methanobacteriati TaxID=3366610 RepID=A0A075G0G5_9EURY|nr:Transcriptional regulator/sugar kinase (scrK) [uncultured marine group II/III euryarchaeote AD1000_61_A07]OIR14791.1 MAG: hypothetical protein BEU04_02650 [Marine Group III euryarchaeote CG-Bathy1]